MRGCMIKIGTQGFHTGNDLDLVQETKLIENPSVQSYSVQIPGRNGLLNLTKALTGRVTYNNREIKLVYVGTGSRSELLDMQDRFNSLHGDTIRIIDDDTPLYYYEGECEIECTIISNYIKISIVVDALPFRYKSDTTLIQGTATSAGTSRIIQNPGVPVNPIIEVSAEMTMTFGERSIKLNAGTYDDLDIILSTGSNSFKFAGTGNYSISFQEARI